MIQRVQSLYWVASVVILVVYIFLPLFAFSENEITKVIYSKDVNYIYGPIIGQIILILISIFLFKKRHLQIFLGYVALVNLVAIGLCLYVKYASLVETHSDLKILPWIFVIVLPILLQILAIRGVKKDEALIKSMDRLR